MALNQPRQNWLLRHMPRRNGGWRNWAVLGMLLGSLWCCALALAAIAPPEITAAVPSSEVWVRDEVPLTITITIRGDLSSFQAEDVGVPDIAGLVRDHSRTVSSQQLSRHSDGTGELTYTIRSFFVAQTPGSYTLGPIELRYRDGGEVRLARIEGPTLLVRDPAAPPTSTADTTAPNPADDPQNPGLAASTEEEGLRDIKDIERAPLDFGLVMTIAATLLLLLIALAVYLLMRNRKRAAPEEMIPYVPPIGLLQRTLQTLDAIPIPDSGSEAQVIADYYLAITTLAKEYLAERYGLRAGERTSWELRQEYRTLLAQRRGDEDPDFLNSFQELFELCDGGKYAHLHATFPLMEEAKRRARTFFETDHRLPGGGLLPIGLGQDAATLLAPEAALTGAASGMRIRAVPARGEIADRAGNHPRGTPRATQLADAALAHPSTSSTLFTAADSASLVNQIAAAAPSSSSAPGPGTP